MTLTLLQGLIHILQEVAMIEPKKIETDIILTTEILPLTHNIIPTAETLDLTLQKKENIIIGKTGGTKIDSKDTM